MTFKPAAARTAVDELYQQGCCKVRFPRRDDGTLETVLLNTAGGLTDGDTVRNEIHWRAGTHATVTTQAAERIYRAASDDNARIATQLTIADDAVAYWLPQETIVFDGARLARSLDVDMTSSGRLVALESTVFGRQAMREVVNTGNVADRWRLRIDGRLVFAEHLRLAGSDDCTIAGQLEQAAVTNAAHCVTTMIVVGDDGDRVVEQARRFVAPRGTTVGASNLGPVTVVRILADNNRALRAAINEITDIELPTVWQC